MENVGKPKYGLINSGLFGFTIVAGIVTGIRFTEDKPVYTISFGKNTWETSHIADDARDLVKTLNLGTLDRIKETHGLKIKFNQ